VTISGTSLVSAVLLAALLASDALGLWGYIGLLCAAFFVASAAASAGHLTVSETFPLEIWAMAIALFYAISTGIGEAVGPLRFGKLLGGDDPTGIAVGYWIAAGLMGIAAITEIAFGVDAEQQSLEDVAEPLSAHSQAAAGTLLGPQARRFATSVSTRSSSHRPLLSRCSASAPMSCRTLVASSRSPAKMRVSAASRMRACSAGWSFVGPSSSSVCTTRP